MGTKQDPLIATTGAHTTWNQWRYQLPGNQQKHNESSLFWNMVMIASKTLILGYDCWKKESNVLLKVSCAFLYKWRFWLKAQAIEVNVYIALYIYTVHILHKH